jgi:hypothetical protein
MSLESAHYCAVFQVATNGKNRKYFEDARSPSSGPAGLEPNMRPLTVPLPTRSDSGRDIYEGLCVLGAHEDFRFFSFGRVVRSKDYIGPVVKGKLRIQDP